MIYNEINVRSVPWKQLLHWKNFPCCARYLHCLLPPNLFYILLHPALSPGMMISQQQPHSLVLWILVGLIHWEVPAGGQKAEERRSPSPHLAGLGWQYFSMNDHNYCFQSSLGYSFSSLQGFLFPFLEPPILLVSMHTTTCWIPFIFAHTFCKQSFH